MSSAKGREEGVKVVLLDIEGTVCPISFVKDVLFPYALTSLTTLLSTSTGWSSPSFVPYREAFPAEHRTSPSAFLAHVQALIASDTKAPYLKALQGHLWLSGYQDGSLACPLFPDVLPALKRWTEKGVQVVIYSSGSVPAQKLLFQYTTQGDLRGFVGGWYDTVNAGMKMERGSYEKIVGDFKEGVVRKEEWLFCSDRVEEVGAARAAGLRARLVVRKGNAVVDREVMRELGSVEGFDEVLINGV